MSTLNASPYIRWTDMSDKSKKTKQGEFTILVEHCADKARLLSVVDQLADSRKQMTITHDVNGSFNVAFNTGPSQKGEY